MTQTIIGIVLYPGVQMSAVLGLTDLFSLAGQIADQRETTAPPFVIRQLVTDMDDVSPVRMLDGQTQERGAGAETCGVLLLPPSLEPPISPEAAAPVARWLRARHAEGVVLGSVCGGAFLLAETGLLCGRTVTTHWTYAQILQDRFPDSRVDADRLVIDGGDIISAGGLMSWVDLGLILVNRYLGPVIMAETARMMLVDPPGREQRYYSGFVPQLAHGDAAILKAQHFLQANEGRTARVSLLAQEAGLEERTFLRRFQKATGMTATDYAQRLRVSKAQELLQFSQQPIEQVAWQVGYSDPGAFRKVFYRIVGLTPGDYRQRFHA
ncbi:GlxA family transcriptional regulator [Thioclava kandeliae]|uniref:Helix-turn-helix domain-containing protein n=1 Tax=Thioclava kandeliae TaxID=3070818 RepID=A0ABV1SLV3_9RHOB